ncbi:MAG: tetratricopeptide repeat protein [Chloroflexaceae bacterium]|nr:tetratricopeptide repeat protein [Chloroflexaceae bacterium]NJO05900.1 tetratricopeptide repeat protein [Chloroflexaceae bacterium]
MTLAKQDEKQRLRRRLQDYAIELASSNRWEEAVDINRQILELGEDPSTFNRLGKAYFEMGTYQEAQDAYQQTLRLNPTNTIARRNLARLEAVISREATPDGVQRTDRQQVDLNMFITEAGKTIITTLTDVAYNPVAGLLSPGERLELVVVGHLVRVEDTNGNLIGMLDPKLSQRLADLITGGNRYTAAVVQSDMRHVRMLIRETYQDPSQHGRTSFPGRLSDDSGGYLPSMRYDYDADELLDEEEAVDEPEIEEDFSDSEEEEEIGLDQIEKDINDDESVDE